MSLITLTTDFGNRDGFVGAMKGVILSIAPHAQIVDISHDIPRQDIAGGAMVLRNACAYFPPKTIHVGVIDPGVGTDRKAIIAVTDQAMYVLPDNGLLTFIHRRTPIRQIYNIQNPDWCLKKVSTTFHGRDVFAPVAAHLALGKSPADAGSEIEEFKKIDIPEPEIKDQTIHGRFLYIDVYGNAFTNIDADLVSQLEGRGEAVFSFAGRKLRGMRRTYAEAARGEALFLISSAGFVELAIHAGNAAKRFGIRRGDRIQLTFGGTDEET